MKKKKRVIFILLFCLLVILGCIAVLCANQKVSRSIMRYCDKREEAKFEVRLEDFTDFEWDHVILYKSPVTLQEIREITGVQYNREPDLQSGMLFVKENKVVYEEVFETDFESPYIFVIYPDADLNSEIKVRSFARDEAVFRGEKIRYEGENRYVFKPVESIYP